MSLHPRLPDELFRYRKRKQLSLDGTVAGVDSTRPRGRPVIAEVGPWGPAPPDYIPPPPRDYEPLPGFPDFAQPEYEPYDPALPHAFTPMIRDPGPEPMPFPDPTPSYDDSLMTDELFADAMAEADSQMLVSEVVPPDSQAYEQEMVVEGESLDALVAGTMSSEPILEIEAAFDQQMQDLTEAFEPPHPEPIQQDPDELQQMYDEQMMDPWQMPGMGPGPMM